MQESFFSEDKNLDSKLCSKGPQSYPALSKEEVSIQAFEYTIKTSNTGGKSTPNRIFLSHQSLFFPMGDSPLLRHMCVEMHQPDILNNTLSSQVLWNIEIFKDFSVADFWNTE